MFPYQKKDGQKNFDWHPGLDNKIKTRRQVGRPKRRWEDDINEYLNPDETKDKTKYDLTNNNSWMTEATRYEEWKKKEEKFFKFCSNFSWIEELNRIRESVLPPPTPSAIGLDVLMCCAETCTSSLHDFQNKYIASSHRIQKQFQHWCDRVS